ncbi:MAG: HAMP domain-containing sensor histidine kinase [Gemmatimonadota bacterium]
MKRDQNDLEANRADTDASLGTERATADTSFSQADAQRKLDALIARDRVLADHQLMMFRAKVDKLLANERSASPAASADLEGERLAADESMEAERSVTDAVLEDERRRGDETRREGRVVTELKAQRVDTNERLSDERSHADAVAGDHDADDSAEAHRRDVFAMVMHDLRNPLCVILANADFLGEDAEDQDVREAAEDVTLAAARMGRLLNDLLDIAHIDAGSFPLNKERHDARALLSEVHRAYRPLFESRGISLTIDAPSEAVMASFDYDRVVQLLSNLLGNAMKFTPTGGSVFLHAEHRNQELVFVVRDDGVGIHPDTLANIFERFWQHDADSRRGLGLGLYICRTIAEAHGGDISVESEVGSGTTFRVSLPAG